MRIVLITNYWKNSDGGGVKNYVVSLVDALRKKSNEVYVFFREGDDPGQFQGGRNKLLFSLACYRKLHENMPEVIYSQGTWYCLLPGVIYKKIHGCRLIHTFHTEPSNKLPPLSKILFQHLLDACDYVTFVSRGLQEQVTEVDGLSFSRTAITQGGVRAENATSDEIRIFRERFQIDPSAPVLLVQAFTANAIKVQGLKLVIRSLNLLKPYHPNITLLVTRAGIYSDELINFTQGEGLENHVIFTGDVQNPVVPISICDVFIFPWLGKGGIGLALLEAMACGKPVIETNVRGISEVIIDGENGMLVEPEVTQIAEKIDYLLKHRDCAEKLGKMAKKTVEERFTWEQAAERFISITEICGMKGVEKL